MQHARESGRVSERLNAARPGLQGPGRAGRPGVRNDPHGQAAPVHREVDLGAQPAAGPADRLARDREGPGGGTTAPFFRAPAACWCARTTVESTLITHSTFPTASSFTTA